MSLLGPEVLKALQKEYIKGFTEKLARIDKFLEIEDWTGLEREFHKFSGSGTTYKMPENSSKISKAIELYLEKHSPPDLGVIKNAVVLFKQVLEARSQEKILGFDEHDAYKKII